MSVSATLKIRLAGLLVPTPLKKIILMLLQWQSYKIIYELLLTYPIKLLCHESDHFFFSFCECSFFAHRRDFEVLQAVFILLPYRIASNAVFLLLESLTPFFLLIFVHLEQRFPKCFFSLATLKVSLVSVDPLPLHS